MSDSCRALHWVLKVGNLKKSMEFFEKILGMKVLRHEEFDSGCEATCNGPYAGAWSKTMIGYGPEENNFALELTYNYGIDSYQFGNDLQYIALYRPDVASQAKELNYNFCDIHGDTLITGPDNYCYRIVDTKPEESCDQVYAVALRVSNLLQAKDYYMNVLGMKEFLNVPGTSSKYDNCVLGYAYEQTKLQLIEISDGKILDHALSSGRIAFATKAEVNSIFEKIEACGDTVITPPLTLPTPGKADVVVTILADRDNYEICFVEEKGFYELAVPTYDKISWSDRASRGADGNPLPRIESVSQSSSFQRISSEAEYMDALTKFSQHVLLISFSASWCKVCKKLYPVIESLAKSSSNLMVFSVDMDADEDFAISMGVTKVPTIYIIKDGIKVEDIVGGDSDILKNLVQKHL